MPAALCPESGYVIIPVSSPDDDYRGFADDINGVLSPDAFAVVVIKQCSCRRRPKVTCKPDLLDPNSISIPGLRSNKHDAAVHLAHARRGRLASSEIVILDFGVCLEKGAHRSGSTA